MSLKVWSVNPWDLLEHLVVSLLHYPCTFLKIPLTLLRVVSLFKKTKLDFSYCNIVAKLHLKKKVSGLLHLLGLGSLRSPGKDLVWVYVCFAGDETSRRVFMKLYVTKLYVTNGLSPEDFRNFFVFMPKLP